MEESTTTTQDSTDSGAEQAQPQQQNEQVAENQTPESANQSDNQNEAEAPSDDNLAWLQNKGIDPSDPEAMAKVAKMYRDAEKQMHQSTEQRAQLQSALSESAQAAQAADQSNGNEQQDQLAQLQYQMQAMQTTSNVNAFFAANPDAKQYESAMAEIVTGNPVVSQLVNGGYFSVEQLYQMARGADTNRDATLRSDGGREALQSVADKQQGKAVQGQATSSAFGSAEKSDPFRDALLGKV